MPVYHGVDNTGPYYQWGNQKKYYYRLGDSISENEARSKAEAQGRAVYSHGWRGN
jgi:hypothetical protein